MELIINSFGTSIGRKQDNFLIVSEDGKQEIPSVGISSIQLSKGAQITSDAVLLAIEKEIEVLFVDKMGNPMGRIWSPKYGSISTIRKGQLNFVFSKDAVEWIKGIITKKIENQQALMLMLKESNIEINTDIILKSVNRLEDYRMKVNQIEGDVISDIAPTIRGWEGLSSKIYFQTLNYYIPEKYQFAMRSQHPAMDVVNALLNYGYGSLYNKIEGALIKAGIDPYLGVMHRDNYNRPVLVYDVIEIYRIWVDYVVYSLVIQDIISDDFFSVREDGSYWLENLGKRILIQSLNDYMNDLIVLDGVSRSRINHIVLYAQSLAQRMKTFN